MYDCIIIGTGPAGLSAALNLKIYNKNFLWFGTKALSEKITKAEKIANYPGLPMVTGAEMFEKFSEQIEMAGLEITEKTVTTVAFMGDFYMVMAENDIYETKTVILATGVMGTKLLENEEKFLGRGLSYCATCDGFLYKNKKIAVICNDRKYEHEVEYLAEMAAEVVFYPLYKEPKVKADNIIVSSELPIAVNGEQKAASLTLRGGKMQDFDGIFCLRNAIAPGSLVPGLAVFDGHVEVNRKMESNLQGLFAAGDCTGRPYQYTKAVGEGNVAAHSVISYLGKE